MSVQLVAIQAASQDAEYLKLPPGLGSKAVFYIKSHQLNEFCCGYNVLFNGCNLEKYCDFPNRFSDYSLFKKTCMNYITHHNLKPKASVSNLTIEKLAYKHLGMQQFCSLQFDEENRIAPIFDTPTEISYIVGTSKLEIQRKLKKAVEERGTRVFEKIKQKLNMPITTTEIVHFMCSIVSEGTGHALLMSIVANKTGKGLYIFDNMNSPISHSSQTMKYIEFICNTFHIQAKHLYKGPYLPKRWPSTPEQKWIVWYE